MIPEAVDLTAIVSIAIFSTCLVVIFTEKFDRVVIAASGAVLMVLAGITLGFYSEQTATKALDLETLGLLFGMMILVALLEPTGFFEFLAIWAAKFSRGSPVRLLVLLGTVTTILSMFLNNVTTIVLIAPVTIMLSEILGVAALPFLISEALLANLGGVATLVGDPPNVIIASAAGFSFTDFLVYSLPIVFVTWIAALALLRYMFRKELAASGKNTEAILKIKPSEAIHDPKTMKKVLIVLGAAIILFFFQAVLHLTPALIALSTTAAGLLWIRPSLNEVFKRVEWGVLIFFASLFVLVGGLEGAGVLNAAAELLSRFLHIQPVLLGLGLLWLVAILSAVVDNIPITIAFIPVIQALAKEGIDPTPLWWALAFGAGLGGNATIIGSTTNVVVVSLAEKTHTPITSALWNKRGLPVMLVTCAVASILYAVAYPWFAR